MIRGISKGMNTSANKFGLLEARRDEIAREIAALKDEDARLERLIAAVEEAVKSLVSQHSPSPPTVEVDSEPQVGGQRSRTTKQLTLEYLGRTPVMWRTANDVQEELSALKGYAVPMSTISPTLSELKKAGLIVRDNLKVALAERVRREDPDFFKENGPPSGDPLSGESDIFA